MSEPIFKPGQHVKVRAEALNGFKVAYQSKINRGRIGIVRGDPICRPSEYCICVSFPKEGRRSEMILERFRASELELA